MKCNSRLGLAVASRRVYPGGIILPARNVRFSQLALDGADCGQGVTCHFSRRDTDSGFRRDKPGGSLGRSVVLDDQKLECQIARGRHAERACYFRIVAVIGVALIIIAWPRLAAAQRFATGGPYNAPAGTTPTAALLGDVGIDQHLDAQLPLDAVFRDEAGREVRLGEYFTDQPVVLALVYYRCPQLCTQVLNGVLKSSQAVPLEIGRDYQVVTVSFDPDEGPELAAEKKRQYVRAYRRDGGERGWHFLTGDRLAIERLAGAVGFRYRYEPRSKQFAHASGIVIATPGGRLARYLYGIDYSPHDLRLGLVDSSAGRIGSAVDQVLLLCYHYDPLTGKYGLAIAGVLRTTGVLTVLGLGTFLVAMYRREKRRPKLTRLTYQP